MSGLFLFLKLSALLQVSPSEWILQTLSCNHENSKQVGVLQGIVKAVVSDIYYSMCVSVDAIFDVKQSCICEEVIDLTFLQQDIAVENSFKKEEQMDVDETGMDGQTEKHLTYILIKKFSEEVIIKSPNHFYCQKILLFK